MIQVKTHLFVPETEENSEKEQSKLQLRLKRNRSDLVEELRQSLREAIKVEKIKIEWKFPFKGGGESRLVSFSIHQKNDKKLFNLCLEMQRSRYGMEISIHFLSFLF